MTTTGSVHLDKVGEALVDAHHVVGSTRDEQAIENALVALCRAAYDVLVEWEVGCAPESREELSSETWRTPLDELRLQFALAEMEMEMEMRVAGEPGRVAADRLVQAVSRQVATARRDVGVAVGALRAELRKVLA